MAESSDVLSWSSLSFYYTGRDEEFYVRMGFNDVNGESLSSADGVSIFAGAMLNSTIK